jgi:crotonobetainyl-CoA:carnitine CoA-transferase CaiB-like acyl-CoA transferase
MLRLQTIQRTTREWIVLLEGAGVPCGPINNIEQVFADPQVIARGMKITMQHPDAGDIPLVASPLNLSGTPVKYVRTPPRLGEHTREVLSDLLDVDEGAYQRLSDDQVV